jgi:hypothetical protein
MKRYKSGDLQVSDAGFGTIFFLKKRKKKQGLWESVRVLEVLWLLKNFTIHAVLQSRVCLEE